MGISTGIVFAFFGGVLLVMRKHQFEKELGRPGRSREGSTQRFASHKKDSQCLLYGSIALFSIGAVTIGIGIFTTFVK